MSDTCLYPSTLLLSLSSDSTPSSTYSTFNSPYQALLCPLLSLHVSLPPSAESFRKKFPREYSPSQLWYSGIPSRLLLGGNRMKGAEYLARNVRFQEGKRRM